MFVKINFITLCLRQYNFLPLSLSKTDAKRRVFADENSLQPPGKLFKGCLPWWTLICHTGRILRLLFYLKSVMFLNIRYGVIALRRKTSRISKMIENRLIKLQFYAILIVRLRMFIYKSQSTSEAVWNVMK